MITFFAFPKPFNKKNNIIQTNAISSWLFLKPRQHVILFGNETGIDKVSEKFHIQHIPDIKRNVYGTPLVNKSFRLISSISKNKYVCFLNADIIVDPKLLSVFKDVSEHFSKFMIISRRWDAKVKNAIDFRDKNWFKKIETYAHQTGQLYSPLGIDLFVFPKGLFKNIPDFAVGRAVMDNWMVYHAKSMNVPVIDITNAVTIVHQKHPIIRDNKYKTTNHNGQEFKENLRLSKGYGYCFSAEDADYKFDPDGTLYQKKSNLKTYYSKVIREVHKIVDPFYLAFLLK